MGVYAKLTGALIPIKREDHLNTLLIIRSLCRTYRKLYNCSMLYH